MPLYQDAQNRLYWHSRLFPVMVPAVMNEVGDWPTVRRVRLDRQATFLVLSGANAVLSMVMALAALVAMGQGMGSGAFMLAIGAVLLALAGPGLLMRWAGEEVRFARALRLAEPVANGVLWGSVGVTAAVLLFYCVCELAGGAGWTALAVMGLMAVHMVRYGLIWRRVPGP